MTEALHVDVDWGSTGLWMPIEAGGYGNCSDYDRFGLPDALVERFRYWTGWLNSREPGAVEDTMDWEAFHAYGYALAIDLKRAVGDRYRVICVHRDWQEIILPDQELIGESVPSGKPA